MDMICKNDIFLPEIIAFYDKHGIVTPLKDVVYSFRSLTKNSEGNYEVLLDQIHNKEILIKHKILGYIKKEPAWNLNRFSTLLGNSISEEEIKQIKQTIEI